MALKSLIQAQVEALNDPGTYSTLHDSLLKVHQTLVAPSSDSLDTRSVLKKETIKVDRRAKAHPSYQLLTCRFVILTSQIITKAIKSTKSSVFDTLSLKNPQSIHQNLPKTLQKAFEKRLKFAFFRLIERKNLVNRIKTQKITPGKQILAAVLLGNYLENRKFRYFRDIFAIFRLKVKRLKRLLRFSHFLFLRKCFWSLILTPKSSETIKNQLLSLFSPLNHMYKSRLKSFFRGLKSLISSKPNSPRNLIKQTAFSQGPFKTINTKVLNKRTLSKWGITQLVRTLAEIRYRNMDKAMVSMGKLLGRKGKMAVVLGKRLGKFKEYVKKSVQRRVNRWWVFTYERRKTENTGSYQRLLALFRVLRDDSLQTCFTRWKDGKSQKYGLNRKSIQIAAKITQFLYQKRLKYAHNRIFSTVFRTKKTAIKREICLILHKIYTKRLFSALNSIQKAKNRPIQLFKAAQKLLILKEIQEKRFKYSAFIQLNRCKFALSKEFYGVKNKKISAVMSFAGIFMQKIVQNAYFSWTKLLFRMKITEKENLMKYFFEKFKQKGTILKENLKFRLKNAIRVMKNYQKYREKRAFLMWSWKKDCENSKKRVGNSVFYPILAKNVQILVQKTLKMPWNRLKNEKTAFKRVKNSILQFEKRIFNLLKRRGVENLRKISKIKGKNEAKIQSAKKILQICLKNDRKIAIFSLKHAANIAKNVKNTQKKGINKLIFWGNSRIYPYKIAFLERISRKSVKYPGKRLLFSLFSALKVRLAPILTVFKFNTSRFTSISGRNKLISVVYLLNSYEKVLKTSIQTHFSTWKTRINRLNSLEIPLKSLFLALKYQLKVTFQYSFHRLKRLKYQLIALEDHGKRVYRLIAVTEGEERDYVRMERLVGVVGKWRKEREREGWEGMRGQQKGKGEETRRNLLGKLGVRKDRRMCETALSTWRAVVKQQVQLSSLDTLHKWKSVCTLDTYRRKCMLLGSWSTLRRTAIHRYWHRKKATRTIADALTTLKVAYLQAAFSALSITFYRYRPSRISKLNPAEKERLIATIALRLSSLDTQGVSLHRQAWLYPPQQPQLPASPPNRLV